MELRLLVRVLSLSQELALTVHFCSTATHTPGATEDYVRTIQFSALVQTYKSKYKEIIKDYAQLIQANPEFAHLYYRGLARFVIKEFISSFTTRAFHLPLKGNNEEDVLQYITQVIQLNPSFAQAYYYRALSRNRFSSRQEIINDFTQAI